MLQENGTLSEFEFKYFSQKIEKFWSKFYMFQFALKLLEINLNINHYWNTKNPHLNSKSLVTWNICWLWEMTLWEIYYFTNV